MLVDASRGRDNKEFRYLNYAGPWVEGRKWWPLPSFFCCVGEIWTHDPEDMNLVLSTAELLRNKKQKAYTNGEGVVFHFPTNWVTISAFPLVILIWYLYRISIHAYAFQRMWLTQPTLKGYSFRCWLNNRRYSSLQLNLLFFHPLCLFSKNVWAAWDSNLEPPVYQTGALNQLS